MGNREFYADNSFNRDLTACNYVTTAASTKGDWSIQGMDLTYANNACDKSILCDSTIYSNGYPVAISSDIDTLDNRISAIEDALNKLRSKVSYGCDRPSIRASLKTLHYPREI